jgi:poly(glycerol-phosphate) alpha-glucosyltransferase
MLDPWAVRNSRWKKWLAHWLYEGAQMRGASCVRALNRAEEEAARLYGLNNPVCVIPNGIDLPTRPPGAPPPWSGKLEEGRRVLLFLGRIHPKKGLEFLLRAWAALKTEAPGKAAAWAAAVAGWDQGGHEAELQALARQLGLERDVLFLGPQFGEAKAACFAHADAFILPSHSEGMPMAVLEAWAYKLPVVMTLPCNLPRGFEAGAAIRVEPDAESVARGVAELMDMAKGERREMGLRGHRLVAEEFAWPRIAVQMEAVYTWLLGGGTPPDHVHLK